MSEREEREREIRVRRYFAPRHPDTKPLALNGPGKRSGRCQRCANDQLAHEKNQVVRLVCADYPRIGEAVVDEDRREDDDRRGEQVGAMQEDGGASSRRRRVGFGG
jgi:hypothetical protein